MEPRNNLRKSKIGLAVLLILLLSAGVSTIAIGVSRVIPASQTYFFFREWEFNMKDYVSYSHIGTSLAISDINGDGSLNVVAGGSVGIWALNGDDGSKLWKFSTDGNPSSTPVIGDINGDGNLEVVAGVNYCGIYALNGEGGSKLWEFSLDGYAISSPVLEDLTGNGNIEVVVADNEGNIYALNGKTGGVIWSHSVPEITHLNFLTIGNLDGQGYPEVILGHGGNMYVLNGYDGSELWNFSTKGSIMSNPVVGDLTGDGNLEVVVGTTRNSYSNHTYIYTLNHIGNQLWNFTTNGDIDYAPALGDLNSDGNLEVVVGSNNYTYGKVYAIMGNNGTELWNFPTEGRIISTTALIDLTGDGNMEVVLGSGDSFEGKLSVFKGNNGTSLCNYSYIGQHRTLSPTNFDMDEYYEIPVKTTHEIFLLEFRLGPKPFMYQGVYTTMGLVSGVALAFSILLIFLYWRRTQMSGTELLEIKDRKQGTKTQSVSYNIKTKNLTKIYRNEFLKNEVVAVDGIDLLVQNGIHGFLGPNGAGKTTTMKMITGAISITKGTAKVKGYKAGTIKAKRYIGFMPQHISFYEGMTGRQHLVHSARLAGIRTRRAYQLADQLLKRFDLEEASDREIDTYSGGMKQKLGLAASFITSPDILILDEPTSDLDPLWRNKIITYIKEFSEESSIFVSSHVLPEIEEMCDTITVINKGKILLTDTVENLKALSEDGISRFIIDTSDNEKVCALLREEEFIEKAEIGTASMIHVLCSDISKLDNFITSIGTYDISLKKYTRQESSLKDIFLQLINEKGG